MIERNHQTPASQEQIDIALNKVIDELRTNWRIEHPTKCELILEMFQVAGDDGLTLDEVSVLFEGVKRPHNSAKTLINYLNQKLEPQGLQIERPPQFYIFPLEEK